MPELDDAIAALAVVQHGVVHRRQIAELGLGPAALRWRVDRGRLRRLARDVFALPGSLPTTHRALWAAHLDAGPRSVVARESSIFLHGLPGWSTEVAQLLVDRRDTGRTPTLGALRTTTHLPPEHVVRRAGLPCTSVARTLLDLAALAPARAQRNIRARHVFDARIARVVDTALAREATTVAELHALLDEVGGPGRRGCGPLRRVMAERPAGYTAPESGLEARFVALCRAAGLPEPRRQVPLGGATVLGRVDFFFEGAGVVVEVDGAPFHDGLLDRERDRKRDNAAASLGLRVIRVREVDLANTPGELVRLLRQALDRARRVA